MAQENKLVGGEYDFTWRGKSTQLGALVDRMQKAFDGYGGVKTESTTGHGRITLMGRGRPDLVFDCRLANGTRTVIVSDTPNIQESFQ